ncbi:MAG: hypothetical protein NTV57_09430 [Cyanobacteria bacterium]|nr:hypothetical protein [Cyanobacteriota bacterium]
MPPLLTAIRTSIRSTAIRPACVLLLGLSLAAGPALAGSITADSVMDKAGARQDAMEQVPKGATITRTRCQEIEIGMDNIRYRCTVWYVKPPMVAPTPAPSPAPAPGSSSTPGS